MIESIYNKFAVKHHLKGNFVWQKSGKNFSTPNKVSTQSRLQSQWNTFQPEDASRLGKNKTIKELK